MGQRGDVALTADIAILGSGGDPHRKAVLMIRQSLDGNSVPLLTWPRMGSASPRCILRRRRRHSTHEVQLHVTAPKTVRIEKRGDYFYAFASGDDGRRHVGLPPR